MSITTSKKLRAKFIFVIATATLMGALLAACGTIPKSTSKASLSDSAGTPSPTVSATNSEVPSPSSSALASPITDPSPSADQPSPTPSSSASASPSTDPSSSADQPSPTPSSSASAPPSTSPSPSADQPSPTPSEKPSTPSATPNVDTQQIQDANKKSDLSNTPADLRRLSWYYLKQGRGKVPNFPPETKTFAANGEKAVWVGNGKHVYLTFDNGGPMGDTDKLLKTLDDNHVKATFFIAGYNLKAHPDFFRKLVADGQRVGNHSMTHTDFNKLTDDQAKKEIKDFETLYHKITGQELTKIFRFPYGTYSNHKLKLVSDLGYTSVFWSTAMKDWVPRKNGVADTYKDIMGNLHDGDIILMHQGSDENIAALDSIIRAIKKAGYEFQLITNPVLAG